MSKNRPGDREEYRRSPTQSRSNSGKKDRSQIACSTNLFRTTSTDRLASIDPLNVLSYITLSKDINIAKIYYLISANETVRTRVKFNLGLSIST